MSTQFLPSCYQLVLQFVLAGLNFLLLRSRRWTQYQTHLSGLGRERHARYGGKQRWWDWNTPLETQAHFSVWNYYSWPYFEVLLQTCLSMNLEVVRLLSAIKKLWNSAPLRHTSFWSSFVSFFMTRSFPHLLLCRLRMRTVRTGLWKPAQKRGRDCSAADILASPGQVFGEGIFPLHHLMMHSKLPIHTIDHLCVVLHPLSQLRTSWLAPLCHCGI